MSFRSRQLLNLAHRVNECQIQLPGVCIGYSVEGCVPSHADTQSAGKGIGIKADDCYHAASCANCNNALSHSKDFDRETKQQYWMRGFMKTTKLYWENGWIRVTK